MGQVVVVVVIVGVVFESVRARSKASSEHRFTSTPYF